MIRRLLQNSPCKSSTLDPLPTWLLFRCRSVFIPFLTILVNAAISEGMPNEYKVSCVTPLLKKKNSDPNDLSNYRPVSNLPFISKLIERAVADQITSHLTMNRHWDPSQYAYRQFHSCETALLHVLKPLMTKRLRFWFFSILVQHLTLSIIPSYLVA